MATAVPETKHARKTPNKDATQIEELLSEVGEADANPLAGLISQAQTADMSYLQARKKVAAAYQERQRRYQESYRQIEQNAARICAETLDKARQALEKAEQEAAQVYLKAKMEANQVYQDTVNEALRVRDETVAQAWEQTKENSEGRSFRARLADRKMLGSCKIMAPMWHIDTAGIGAWPVGGE